MFDGVLSKEPENIMHADSLNALFALFINFYQFQQFCQNINKCFDKKV